MAASYLRQNINEPAIFELFVRRLPPNRDWLLAAGLGPTLELIRELRFGERELEYLRSLELFGDDFLDYLAAFRFRGDLEAMPEGTVCFANEPLIRVTAPRIEAQLLETLLLNQINFQTMVATKAARVVLAAGGGEPGAGERVVDFSPRRDHGIDAAMKVARSAAVAGCGGTSNVAAAMRYGLRPVGTMAHSYVLSFDSEEAAFRSFMEDFPETAVILVDTYDTLDGVRHAIAASRDAGVPLAGVRLDSGDLLELSRAARRLLDEAGMSETRIAASGDLEEGGSPSWSPRARRWTCGASAPTSGPAATRRSSTASTSWSPTGAPTAGGGSGSSRRTSRRCPARSRCSAATTSGIMSADVIAAADEELEGEPLLVPAMREGEVVRRESLEEIRARSAAQLAALPERLRRPVAGEGGALPGELLGATAHGDRATLAYGGRRRTTPGARPPRRRAGLRPPAVGG